MTPADTRRFLILPGPWKVICTVLQVIPVPGVGAIIAGRRNPQSRLFGKGVAQAILVVLGSWPLIIPGVAGFAWACWTAYTIHRDAVPAPRWSRPLPIR